MSFLKKKRDVVAINLATMMPLENLHSENLNALSREEMMTYLNHYDIKPSFPDDTNDLKNNLRNLVVKLRSGEIPRREGIGTKFNPNQFSKEPPRTNSVSSPSSNSSYANSQSSTTQYVQSDHHGQTIPNRPNSTPLPSNILPAQHQHQIQKSVTPDILAKRSSNATSGTAATQSTKPIVADLVVPNAIEKFTTSQLHSLNNYAVYHDYIDISMHEHMYDPRKKHSQNPAESGNLSAPQPANRLPAYFESINQQNFNNNGLMSQSSSKINESSTKCSNCGTRAPKDCKYKKCKKCCTTSNINNHIHYRCTFHRPNSPAIDTTTPSYNYYFDSSASKAFSTKPTTKPKPATYPLVPRPFRAFLGEKEIIEPWNSIRNSTIHRHRQNSESMMDIFDYSRIDQIRVSLQNSLTESVESLKEKINAACSENAQMELSHMTKLNQLTSKSHKFFQNYDELMKLEFPRDNDKFENLLEAHFDESIPPLIPRKRTASEAKLYQPTPVRKPSPN